MLRNHALGRTALKRVFVSLFFATSRALLGLLVGRLSDRVGRKALIHPTQNRWACRLHGHLRPLRFSGESLAAWSLSFPAGNCFSDGDSTCASLRGRSHPTGQGRSVHEPVLLVAVHWNGDRSAPGGSDRSGLVVSGHVLRDGRVEPGLALPWFCAPYPPTAIFPRKRGQSRSLQYAGW